VNDLVHDLCKIIACEQQPPGQTAVRHGCERIDVGRVRDRVAARLFRRHVCRRADERVAGQRAVRTDFRYSKIEDLPYAFAAGILAGAIEGAPSVMHVSCPETDALLSVDVQLVTSTDGIVDGAPPRMQSSLPLTERPGIASHADTSAAGAGDRAAPPMQSSCPVADAPVSVDVQLVTSADGIGEGAPLRMHVSLPVTERPVRRDRVHRKKVDLVRAVRLE
jgi:hypothetical protein